MTKCKQTTKAAVKFKVSRLSRRL